MKSPVVPGLQKGLSLRGLLGEKGSGSTNSSGVLQQSQAWHELRDYENVKDAGSCQQQETL